MPKGIPKGGIRKPRRPTLKQQKFIDAYLGEARQNATEAARIAGYPGDDKQLSVTGFNVLVSASVQNVLANVPKTIGFGGLREVDNRVTGYLERLEQFAEIVRERRSDDGYGTNSELGYEPGARSGWLARKVRITRRFDKRTGDMVGETVDVEYKFDTGLAKEMRELERQIAIELRQWSEKQEHHIKTNGQLAISEIEVLKQLPSEVRELDDMDAEDDAPEAPTIIEAEFSDVKAETEPVSEGTESFAGWGFDDDD